LKTLTKLNVIVNAIFGKGYYSFYITKFLFRNNFYENVDVIKYTNKNDSKYTPWNTAEEKLSVDESFSTWKPFL
jgi:hypothetical protein